MMSLPHRYTFVNPMIFKAVDALGVVHETITVVQPGAHRATCCEQLWVDVEPVRSVDWDTPTTCIACLGYIEQERARRVAEDKVVAAIGVPKEYVLGRGQSSFMMWIVE